MSNFSEPIPTREFDYRPMPVIVPIAGVMALVAASAYLGLIGIIMSIISVGVGIVAWRTVGSSDGQYSGLWVARIACLLSLIFFVTGTGQLVYAFNTEVPEGYRRISFSQDISKKGFKIVGGKAGVHEDVKKLTDRKIFLKGFMYPQRQTKGIKEFLLLKDSGECCFGGQPAQSDMVLVRMNDEKGVDYIGGSRIAVAGTFRIAKNAVTPEGLQPVYALEADHFGKAKTSF